MKMIKELLARFKKNEQNTDRVKYDAWVKSFSDHIFECTRSNAAVKAEIECWPFTPEEIMYDWRDFDPVDAANEALSYYRD